MKIETGILIGPYRLLKECGAGAYGRVFWVENTLTEQRLALKILLPLGTTQQRELRALCRYRTLKHPHLLQIYHIDYWEDHLYYTMEAADSLNSDKDDYVPDTLANRLKRDQRLPLATLKKIEQELSSGIQALHAQNSFHRDIKPENILWVNGMAVLGDIGLVAASEDASLIGTPDFMSPAVLCHHRQLEPKDDFYALGKVLYCALTGSGVREFPRFPADLNITKAAPIWNRILELCAEDGIVPPIPKHRRTRLFILLSLLLIGCVTLGIFRISLSLRRKPVSPQSIEGIIPHALPEIPKPEIPKPEILKPEIPNPEIPKPEMPKPEIPKPEKIAEAKPMGGPTKIVTPREVAKPVKSNTPSRTTRSSRRLVEDGTGRM